jgi:hypothetical protein
VRNKEQETRLTLQEHDDDDDDDDDDENTLLWQRIKTQQPENPRRPPSSHKSKYSPNMVDNFNKCFCNIHIDI